MRNQIDRTLGWIVVTIVGFLTAVIAFLIVRSEQWLFDSKEGFCRNGWWKAKRSCCPSQGEDDFITRAALSLTGAADEVCDAWRTWADVFGPAVKRGGQGNAEMVQYVAYTCVALVLALLSAFLTIHLTASNSFSTRKDSGVLGPSFDEEDKQHEALAVPEPKRKVLYYAAGSGIPEIKTILSGFVIHGYLGGRTLFTKSVGLALSVASGLSLGKEGPFVHIASCVGNIVSRYFAKYENNEGKRREILSAASAAGVAVAFGAPIGGTLFSLEEVSYFFPPKVMWRSFFCAMIAAITLRFLNPFGTGKLVLFQVTYDKDWHAYELFFFVLLGVFGGVYGSYFSKLNYRWSRHVRNGTWLKTHPVSEVLLVTLVTALLSFLNPYTRMGGTELVYNLFAECRSGSVNSHEGLCVLDPPKQAWPAIKAIAVALLVKGALTIVTFGIKVPAGIFIPTLGVGACAGRILGILVQWMQFKYPQSSLFASCHGDLDCVIPGLYAMVGAAATLAGATRTTVSLAVIMFELTDTLTYAVPVMLSVLVAKTVADAIEPKGIYDLVIELSQLPYLDAKHNHVWGDLQVNDATDRDVDIIRADRQNTVESLRDKLQGLVAAGYDDGGFPIVRKVDNETEGLRLIGYIGANELEHALSIVADSADSPVHFRTGEAYRHGDLAASSISFSSMTENHPAVDPFDFSVYMDQAPLTVQSNSPLELVQEFFVKLGAKYVIVTDADGFYEGLIDKKAWLAFLEELEHRS
ncbi:clc channel [Gloeophyllum trabeum ATCC 11539]|uniref:Clc channel n=1 Tax=Gloeophyllum trabeum (strain ATCC 11539 / FP-39264 / Madison 617) TaxID=670483 RepID=S7RVG5_GLOTA|nr:clc channel [Gloeophyllum trabeum ATCC 11539]EPQ57244.1 clc channel [Gloeophyllum trabeum ATCC 11539]